MAILAAHESQKTLAESEISEAEAANVEQKIRDTLDAYNEDTQKKLLEEVQRDVSLQAILGNVDSTKSESPCGDGGTSVESESQQSTRDALPEQSRLPHEAKFDLNMPGAFVNHREKIEGRMDLFPVLLCLSHSVTMLVGMALVNAFGIDPVNAIILIAICCTAYFVIMTIRHNRRSNL
ncbi:hypothetical protein HYFRA_00003584 [Hymenoscyphus fraxineus]|uniref:Uncharacterized protein n=1 Tax=Hymenoscyphus fraxineus TaxID=746836 RepID=A0A9N9KYK1_9HELO|nr:hypothetical protein HYFRA_00003584 [Hymenoscyphus fraxineus]